MQLLIRQYRPSDKDTVINLFSTGNKEHIGQCFQNAITCPLYLTITLALCVAGYLLGSVLGAVVLPGAWMGLIYYYCYELYAGFVREQLQTDMQDINRNYMSRPDDCLWVAEAEVDGRAQVLGMVAVVGKQSGKVRYGKLCRMAISPSCRRMGLGVRMAQTVIDFCKDRGFSKVVLETSSTQTAALALYKKVGFSHDLSDTETGPHTWIPMLTRAKRIIMKKDL